jgi:hypothetical protein
MLVPPLTTDGLARNGTDLNQEFDCDAPLNKSSLFFEFILLIQAVSQSLTYEDTRLQVKYQQKLRTS